MSVSSLANSRGKDVVIRVAGAPTIDSVGTQAYVSGAFSTRTVKAYIADGGTTFQMEDGRPAAIRTVTFYIPGNDAITAFTDVVIEGDVYFVTNVVHPGLKTRGAMAYTKVEATLDPRKT